MISATYVPRIGRQDWQCQSIVRRELDLIRPYDLGPV